MIYLQDPDDPNDQSHIDCNYQKQNKKDSVQTSLPPAVQPRTESRLRILLLRVLHPENARATVMYYNYCEDCVSHQIFKEKQDTSQATPRSGGG